MTRLLCTSASGHPLSQPLPAGTEIVSGTPAAAYQELHEAAGVCFGLWEMTPGVARDIEVDEVFVVLSGAGTVSFDDGEVLELAPGTVVRLRAGERTEWSISTPLRKLYIALPPTD
jgi:uncharacterized cupin superfamily protein